MSAMSLTAENSANTPTAQTCGTSRTIVRFTQTVMAAAQRIFADEKPIPAVADITKCAIRTAEYWKAGQRSMSAEQFVELLKNDKVDQATAFMDVLWEQVPEATRERWWQSQELKRKLEQANRKIAATQRAAQQLRLELNKR